jgi:hypothetical protein
MRAVPKALARPPALPRFGSAWCGLSRGSARSPLAGAQFDAIGSTNWGDYTTTTGILPLPAGCQGIRIESNDIGTTNTIPWKINTNADNTFQAKLTTTGGAAMPAAGTVKARFRIANWGMQIGVGGDWFDIAGGSCVGGCTNGQSGNPTNIIQYSCPFTGPGSCPPAQHDCTR